MNKKTKVINLNPAIINEIVKEVGENVSYVPELSDLYEQAINQFKETNSVDPKLLKKILYNISTLRNRLLINAREQDELKDKVIAFFGLSVGSAAVVNWLMETRANCVKISDPDTISPTNLNRIVTGWNNIGKSKVESIKETIYEISPFCKIFSFVSKDLITIEKIIKTQPKTDLIIEQVDNLEAKIRIRKVAKLYKIPLLMATDVGENVFLDVERYDLDDNIEYFNGRVKGIEKIDLSKLSRNKFVQLATKIVGKEHNSEKMLESLVQIGKKIKTWPQLGSTASIAGGVLAKTARKILLGEHIKSGRYYFNYDQMVSNKQN